MSALETSSKTEGATPIEPGMGAARLGNLEGLRYVYAASSRRAGGPSLGIH